MPQNRISEQQLDAIGEDFSRRLRRGESPSIEEYCREHPQHAAEIEEFLESIAMLEELKGESAPQRSEGLPGEFGRYQVERSLGEGGMGAVYLARDKQLDRKVALKTPKFAADEDNNMMERFYREARAAATLQHPNICPIYEIGEIDGVHYISMALIEGRSLSAYIKSDSSVNGAVRVVRKVAAALHEAHALGVVHRDLKPGNIMIDKRNEPIVMDFGLAQQQRGDNDDRPDASTSADFSRLTQDGMLLGSPGYMSPEQIQGAQVGPGSDIYSLGVVLFELLTGRLPFPGNGSAVSIMSQVLNSDPPEACSIRPDIDEQLSEICAKAIRRDVEQRFLSMREFAAALTGYLKSKTANDGQLAPSPALSLASTHVADGAEVDKADLLEISGHTTIRPQGALTEPFRQSTVERPKPTSLSGWYFGGVMTLLVLTLISTSLIASRVWNGAGGQTASKRDAKEAETSKTDAAAADGSRSTAAGIQPRSDSPRRNSPDASRNDPPRNDPPRRDSSRYPPARPLGARSPFGAGRFSVVERLRRLDANQDGLISKTELTGIPSPHAALNRIADRFDFFDRDPPDGFLDSGEIRFIERVIMRPGNRENRRGTMRP